MPEDLRQRHEVVPVVFEKSVRHRVPSKDADGVLNPQIAEYLSHSARTPRSVSGPRSPTKTFDEATEGRTSSHA